MANTVIKHVAFFGATGGSMLSCLDRTLGEPQFRCYALVRSESKLRALLAERSVPDGDLARLTIVEGDVMDRIAVQNVLFVTLGTVRIAVDIIVCGIGGPLKWKNPLKPTMPDRHICEQAIKSILAALAPLKGTEAPKPRLAVISTTGISRTGQDIPSFVRVPYNWLLRVPRKDKLEMERTIRAETDKPAKERIIGSTLVVRPSFMTNGHCTSMRKIKVGGDDIATTGCRISREDVGLYLFHTAICGILDGVFTITT